MRTLVRSLTVFAVAALLCLVFPALIQRADADPQSPGQEAAITVCVSCCEADLPVNHNALPAQARVVHTEHALLTGTAPQTVVPVITDGNGRPLGNMTWWQAVWIANPPEGIPGS